MVKEIERAGIPVVHMCTVVPISLTVGANRIVPTVAKVFGRVFIVDNLLTV